MIVSSENIPFSPEARAKAGKQEADETAQKADDWTPWTA